MIDKKSFKKTIAVPLEKAGFKRKGQSWYLNGRDAMVGLNLQKSDWWDSYFINIVIRLREVGETTSDSNSVTHLSHGVETLFPSRLEIIRKGTSLDTGDFQSLANLSTFLQHELIPFLQSCTLIENLRKEFKAGRFKRGLVEKNAKLYLSKE
jgi:hypothetical protein